MKTARHKHGTVTQQADGHTIETGFGKDDSDVGGGERYPKLKGGPRDLSHSLTSGSSSDPKAHGRSGGGRRDDY